MIADTIKIDCEEDGFHMRIETTEDDSVLDFWIAEAEKFYDTVKAAILPWLMERDEALREYRLMSAAVEDDAREAYDRSDPKHPDFHSVHVDLWDNRDKTAGV